jgi:site-specific DNA recombinase
MTSTNGHGPKRAILYARVSTDEQARSGYSLAQQQEALREYTAREGYEVLEEVQDPGQSGVSLERPGMDRVRDLVAAGGVAVVLAQDRDRFSREPAYHYLLRREFEEKGTKLRALNDRGDESPEGELTDGILDQLAKYERAKIAERTRRGKLRRAREGKVVVSALPDYGFRFNATRDNYLVIREEMRVVERIFRMIGVEGATIHAVKRAFEEEGLKTPGGGRYWNEPFIKSRVLDDVYRPHSFEEIRELVLPEVAVRLDPEKHYGVWWYNRRRQRRVQVSEAGQDGRRYRHRTITTEKPRAEWIAVPVPASGIPREWVDAAREAVKHNRRPSSAGLRFWELSGGLFFCGGCGLTMHTRHTKAKGDARYFYYRCALRARHGRDACPQHKNYPAEEVEAAVWRVLSCLLKDPQRLRAGLEEMIELERNGLRGDPDEQADMWLLRVTEAERMRGGYQELAAKGLMTLEELGEKLAELEATKRTAERELATLTNRRESIEKLEGDKEALLESLIAVTPEALDGLVPEERHRIYRMIKLRAAALLDGGIEVSGNIAPANEVSTVELAS